MKLYRHYLYCPDYSPNYHEVKISPRGWKDVKKRQFRHDVYHSVLWVDTLETRFVNYGHNDLDYGGYHFIKDAIYQFSPDVQIQYIVQKLNVYTRSYESYWSGILDTTPKSGYLETLDFISVKTIDSRKLANFLSFDETKFNVFSDKSVNGTTINNNISRTIVIPTIDIYLTCESQGSFIEEYNQSTSGVTLTNSISAAYSNNEIEERLKQSGTVIYTNELEIETNLKITASGTSSLFVTIEDALGINWNVKKSIIYKSYNSSSIGLITETYNFLDYSGSGNVNELEIQDNAPINFEYNLDVPVGGYIELYETITFTADTTVTLRLVSETNPISIVYVEKTEGEQDTSVSCALIKNALTKAIQIATNETITSKALSFNKSEFNNTVITNGRLIRRIYNSPLNISIRDMFKDLFSKIPIGLWYDKTNDRFEIRDINEYYKTTEFEFSPSNVNDLEISLSEKYYWNSIKAGYQTSKVEEYQGANDYNCAYEYSSLFQIDNKIDLQSPYYGDSISVEKLRRDGGTSQENENDKNVYVFQSNGTILTQATGFTGFEGIEQYYNPDYTPRKNMVRHNKWLASQFFNKSNGKVTFENSDKNKNIYNGTSNEFADILRPIQSELLFLPYIYKFTWYINEDFKEELKSDPHRKLVFTDSEGTVRKGYVLSLEYQDYTNECEFELLMCNPYR